MEMLVRTPSSDISMIFGYNSSIGGGGMNTIADEPFLKKSFLIEIIKLNFLQLPIFHFFPLKK